MRAATEFETAGPPQASPTYVRDSLSLFLLISAVFLGALRSGFAALAAVSEIAGSIFMVTDRVCPAQGFSCGVLDDTTGLNAQGIQVVNLFQEGKV